MKKNKHKNEEFSETDLEETIKFIFKTKEKDVFKNEFDKLNEELKSENFKTIKSFILSNFVSTKISQLNEQHDFTKHILKKSNNFDLNIENHLDIDQYQQAKNIMTDDFKSYLNLCKKSIDNDFNNLSFLNKITNRENNFVENENEINNLCKNLQPIKKQYEINNKSSSDTDSEETITQYQLKITYQDGSESYPQFLKISNQEFSTFENFIYILKRKLGIYEYAKFKLVYLENNKGIKIILKKRKIFCYVN